MRAALMNSVSEGALLAPSDTLFDRERVVPIAEFRGELALAYWRKEVRGDPTLLLQHYPDRDAYAVFRREPTRSEFQRLTEAALERAKLVAETIGAIALDGHSFEAPWPAQPYSPCAPEAWR
jgi:hypothetical protein